MNIQLFLDKVRYQVSERVFRWVEDEDGDVGLEVFGLVTFVKYKHSTIVGWKRHYKSARRYL